MNYESTTLNARAFGFAAGTIAAALTTICALALVIAPQATTSLASTLIHLDLSQMSRSLTWSGYFTGLIAWTIGAGLVFWAAAALYNRFSARAQSIVAAERGFATR
jgi:hypothetical protein